MTASVQVWGPVMVVAYPGTEELRATLATVSADPSYEEIKAAVVDLSGARIDELEAARISGLVGALRVEGVEVILCGIAAELHERLRQPDGEPIAPLIAANLSRAIALGFQLCQITDRAQ